MKPTKNHIFCIGCKRHKMLFESQSKANNFIKFNGEEIAAQSGKVPSRTYYCSFCCGWHITSIADADKAAECDKRDGQVWENFSKAIASKKNTKKEKDHQPKPKTRKIPKTEEGNKLRIIAREIDDVIVRAESALVTADVTKLRENIEVLLNLEKKLRLKSAEFNINVTSIDKRYNKIADLKRLFNYVFDYFVDGVKRQKYLVNLTNEDFSKKENIIIHNIEIINEIKSCFEQINSLSNLSDSEKINELCNQITISLLPQLKGETSKLKKNFGYEVEKILSKLPCSKQKVDSYYKGLMLSIIGHLENAYNAYNINDFDTCEHCLRQAEDLLPDTSTDMEIALYNQIINLKNLIN